MATIHFGSTPIRRMEYDQVQPGDFVCTYEALTARTDLLFFETAQWFASFSHRPELNKTFHSQIILQRLPRPGLYRVAHAEGATKKMIVQEDNYKEHHPGQAFIIFRAKDPAVQREIVRVAHKTAELGNGHICRTLSFETLINRIRFALQFFLFENIERHFTCLIAKSLKTMMDHYQQSGRFYGTDGSGSQEMSCMEYVANVINIATLRALKKETTAFDELPLQFSHPHVSAAAFVEYFLNKHRYFEIIGYLGVVHYPLVGPQLDIKGRIVPISTNYPPHTLHAMKILGMLSDSGELYEKAASDPIKVKTLSQITTPQDALSILMREEENIRAAPMERTERTRRLAHNALLRSDNRQKIEELLILHEAARKNGKVTLTSTDIPQKHRPWIRYFVNKWDMEPFKGSNGKWEAAFQIPKGSSYLYELFIGPDDVNDPDPFTKSIARQFESTLAQSEEITLLNPKWCGFPKHLPFAEKCQEKGPTETTPATIQAYQELYTSLEAELEMRQDLISFIHGEIGLTVTAEQIRPLQGGLGKGLSGDLLFKVVDKNQQPLFVIKVFLNSKGKCTREFITLMSHERLKLQSLHIPKVLGISAVDLEGKIAFALATSFVPGVTLYEMFLDLTKHKIGSAERSLSFQKLQHVYAKLGEAIGEFHRSNRGEARPLQPFFADVLEAFYKNALKKFKTHLDPQFLERLTLYMNSRFPVESKKPFVRGNHHGDVNAGNLLYHAAEDRLSLVDWSDGSFSVGSGGVPLGIPFYDLIQIENELINRRAQGASEEECRELWQICRASYNGNDLPQESLDFFTSIDLMGSLKWFIDKKAVFEERGEHEAAEAIYLAKLTKLKQIIARHFMSKL